MNVIIIAVVAILVLLLIFYFFLSNILIGRKNRVDECLSTICVFEKQRADQLVSMATTLKKYMSYESDLITKMVAMRSQSESSEGEKPEPPLKTTLFLPSIKGVVEDNPEIKADDQVQNLMAAIDQLECYLQAARRTYTSAVIDYNNAVTMYPTCFVASFKGLKTLEYLEINQEERDLPDLNQLL